MLILNQGRMMLNPNWKKYDYETDLQKWMRVKNTPPEFLSLRYSDIFNLLSRYGATEAGGNMNVQRFSEQQRYRILEKTMEELSMAVAHNKLEQSREWEERQKQDESLDAKLEREKGEYESREASLRLSQREKLPIYQPDDSKIGSIPWGDDAIQVRSTAPYDYASEEKTEHGTHLTFYPWKFIGYIYPDKKEAKLEDVHVHPDFRKQGVAKNMIESFMRLCQKYGVNTINGIAYRSAVDFWKHIGFDVNYDEQRDINRVNKKLSCRDK